jgi:hypothetical protein
VRDDAGDIWDHFVVTFEYPDNIAFSFSSRQFNGHGTMPEGIRNRMFGSKGVLETEYGGTVLIRGENFFRGALHPILSGVVTNEDVRKISPGDCTVNSRCKRPNLVTIPAEQPPEVVQSTGRTIKSNQKLEANPMGLKVWVAVSNSGTNGLTLVVVNVQTIREGH